MSEKLRISEYKGFELWDCPMPQGWTVNAYPVQVTCNGQHVNAFANAHDAMKVIDSMDADTVAYHMRRAPVPTDASAPSVPDAGAAFSVDGVNVKFDHTDAEMFLQSLAQRDQDVVRLESELAETRARLAAVEGALEPFAEAWVEIPLGLRSVLRIWNGEIDDDSKYVATRVSTDDLEAAHTAYFGLQASEPAASTEGE